MYKYTAIIVEPRRHKALRFVLENYFSNLSEEWGFILFHGTLNMDYILNILDNELPQYRYRVMKLINMGVDNLTIGDYNKLFKTPQLYEHIDTEMFLVFHTDSMILPKHKDLIRRFMKYDYVGAPWRDHSVGNGGLSLRRKSKMVEICHKVHPSFHEQEDVWFCYQTAVELSRPAFEEAQLFSIETVFHDYSFGIHAPWKHLSKPLMDYLIQENPEIATLISLQ
jgi:hypothetical protein